MDEELSPGNVSASSAVSPYVNEARSAIQELTGSLGQNRAQQDELVSQASTVRDRANELTPNSALKALLPSIISLGAGLAIGGKEGLAHGAVGAGVAVKTQAEQLERGIKDELSGIDLNLKPLLRRESELMSELSKERSFIRSTEIQAELRDVQAAQALAAETRNEVFQKSMAKLRHDYNLETIDYQAAKGNSVGAASDRKREFTVKWLAESFGGDTPENRVKANMVVARSYVNLAGGAKGEPLRGEALKAVSRVLADSGVYKSPEEAEGMISAVPKDMLSGLMWQNVNLKSLPLKEASLQFRKNMESVKMATTYRQTRGLAEVGIYPQADAIIDKKDIARTTNAKALLDDAKDAALRLQDTIDRSGTFEFSPSLLKQNQEDAILLNGLREELLQAAAQLEALKTGGTAQPSEAMKRRIEKRLPDVQKMTSSLIYDSAAIGVIHELINDLEKDFQRSYKIKGFTDDPKKAMTKETVGAVVRSLDADTARAAAAYVTSPMDMDIEDPELEEHYDEIRQNLLNLPGLGEE